MEKRGLGRGLAALIPEIKQGTDGEETRVLHVPVAQIAANPFQPRTVFDPEKMADLVASVQEHGILQPVLVRQIGMDRFQLVAGERRFRAAQKAGLATIPAVVRDCTDREQLEMAVVENLQREDIGVMEAARAYRKLIDEFEMTQDTVAQRVGKSRSAVANILRLLKLPDEVQESLEKGEISEGHARALMMAEHTMAVLHTWQQVLKKQLSVRDTEKLAKSARDAGSRQTIAPAAGSQAGRSAESGQDRTAMSGRSDPNEADVVDRLQQALGTKVALRRTANGSGRLEIEFYSDQDLERLTAALLSAEGGN